MMDCRIEHSQESIRKRWGLKPARLPSADISNKYPRASRPRFSNSALRSLVKRVIMRLSPVKNRSARTHHCRVAKSITNNLSSNSSDGGASDPDNAWLKYLTPTSLSALIFIILIFVFISYVEVAK